MDLTSRTIVLTGGFGYVGGRIAQALLAKGAQVRVSTRRSRQQVPPWALENDNIQWSADLPALCKDADTILHLAAPNEIAASKAPEKSIDETVALTQAALDAAKAQNVPYFIYFSTIHVYGAPLSGELKETSPTDPAHPYALAHLKSEGLVLAQAEAGLRTLILRLSNSFGAPADPLTDRWSLVVNDLCRQVSGTRRMALETSGAQLRDFIPLTDVVNATLHFIAGHQQARQSNIINLASGACISVRDMAEKALARARIAIGEDVILDVPEVPNSGTASTYRINTGRLLESGFQPALAFDQEIDTLIEFCRTAKSG